MKNYLIGLTALAGGLPAAAYAQDTGVLAPNEAPDDADDIVVTASGFAQPREETGAAIDVIDRDRLDQLQTPTIAAALQTLPGVQVVQRGPVGSQTSLFIRGANSSQTLVIVDGVRINDPSSPNGAFDFGALLTANIGRVELLRGPNSIIWGSQAIGGVIAIQSLLPTDALVARGSIEYGYADTARISGNVSGGSGRFRASVGGGWFDSDGISALRGGTERDGYRNKSANARVDVALSDTVSLDLRGFYNDGRIEYDSPFGIGADALPVSDNRQLLGYAGLNAVLADGRWRNRLSYARTDIRRVGTDPVPLSFNNFVVSGEIDRFEYHGTAEFSRAFALTYGVEHERTTAAVSFEGAAADRSRNHVLSGFLQAQLAPLPGLTLTSGLRHDDYTDYGGQTTFGGNAAYTPDEGVTVLRATYAEGFRAPTLSEGQPPFGNPDLKPETARNVDIGIERSFAEDRARASVTWFQRRSNDLIAFSTTTFQSENIDRVKASGVEVAVNLRPTDRWAVVGSYTLTDAIDRSPGLFAGNRLALRPQHIASLTADWQSPWGVALGGSLLMVGDSFDNRANTVRIDGYALAGVRATVPITTNVELFGRVDNLFDARYETVAGYNSYGRSLFIGVRGTL